MDQTVLNLQLENPEETEVSKALKHVAAALNEKGYNPIAQLSGYLMTGDPTYITNHNGARKTIVSIERDELLEALLNSFLGSDVE